jgi:hypothetical protein
MNHWTRSMALLTTGAFLTTGCTTLQHVPLQGAGSAEAAQRPDVKVGESVVVTRKDGEKQAFTVTAVDTDAVAGKNVRIAYTDIASLDVRRSDAHANKMALIVGAVVVGVAAAAAAGGGGGGSSGY